MKALMLPGGVSAGSAEPGSLLALLVSRASKSLGDFQALPSQHIPPLSLYCFLMMTSPDQCFINFCERKASKKEKSTKLPCIIQPGPVHEGGLEGPSLLPPGLRHHVSDWSIF